MLKKKLYKNIILLTGHVAATLQLRSIKQPFVIESSVANLKN